MGICTAPCANAAVDGRHPSKPRPVYRYVHTNQKRSSLVVARHVMNGKRLHRWMPSVLPHHFTDPHLKEGLHHMHQASHDIGQLKVLSQFTGMNGVFFCFSFSSKGNVPRAYGPIVKFRKRLQRRPLLHGKGFCSFSQCMEQGFNRIDIGGHFIH